MIPIEALRNLFPNFEKGLLDEIVAVSLLREFNEGTLLMKTGQYFRSTMIVLEGVVKIYREDDEGNEYFMYYIEPGQACALSMICALRQESSEIMAKAATNVTLISIPLDKMDEWMNKYKSWSQFVLGNYRHRMEEIISTIDHIAFRNMDERLVFYLKNHQRTLKSNFIPYTHAEIAQELNSSREVITRLMKKLAYKGMIKLHRQNIEIIDLEKW
jgi:CRP/FNR family transcriptional regulator